MDRLDPFEVTHSCAGAAPGIAVGAPIDVEDRPESGHDARRSRRRLIRTGEAVLAGRLSSALGALAADFEREIL